MQAHRYFIVICISGIFQFLLFIYKRMKAKQITTQQRLASILAGKSSIVRTKIALFFELPRKLPPCEWNGDLLGGDGDMRHHRVIQQVLQDCGGQVCKQTRSSQHCNLTHMISAKCCPQCRSRSPVLASSSSSGDLFSRTTLYGESRPT